MCRTTTSSFCNTRHVIPLAASIPPRTVALLWNSSDVSITFGSVYNFIIYWCLFQQQQDSQYNFSVFKYNRYRWQKRILQVSQTLGRDHLLTCGEQKQPVTWKASQEYTFRGKKQQLYWMYCPSHTRWSGELDNVNICMFRLTSAPGWCAASRKAL